MCGRYVSSTPVRDLAARFAVSTPLPNAAPSWNVAPTQSAPVVRRHPQTGERHLDLLSWGFVPHWTKDIAEARRPINARAETVATSPMWREAVHRRRCLVPADAFYEWHATPDGKQPYAIARQDGQPMAFAGIWDGWRGPGGEVIRSFAIVVTAANATMAPIHDRMPVIMEPADWPAWMGEADGDPLALLRPAAEDVLRIWPVGRAVNAPRNNGPELLEPGVPGHAAS
jgi:putative SOS response-associated peptidase YedK